MSENSSYGVGMIFDTELGQEKACNLQKMVHIWLTKVF